MNCVGGFHAVLAAWVLVLSADTARGIMVKFGTNTGPIVPPTPEPKVVAVPPYKEPAPVWEEIRDDLPDPNATWRPKHLFTKIQIPFTQEKGPARPGPIPSQSYALSNGPDPSQVPPPSEEPTEEPTPAQKTTTSKFNLQNLFSPEETYAPKPTPVLTQTNAQKFVASYIPTRQSQDEEPRNTVNSYQVQKEELPILASSSNHVTHLSSQFVPGFGIRYYIPLSSSTHLKVLQKLKDDARRHEDSYQNHIDNNEVESQRSDYYDALAEEKESRRRSKGTFLGSQKEFFYWPVYHHQRRH